MSGDNKPRWSFPPLNGGIDVVQNSASEFFTDNPLSKLVRETIQNSLDAKLDGLSEPVKVVFTESVINRDVFDGMTLRGHLRACHERVRSEGLDPAIGRFYKKADSALRKNIRVLSIVDSGTMGLNSLSRWNALVKQEGAVDKVSQAAGGSFGIGKNAVFNVSAVRTVLYSTYYLAGRRGRQEKIQGKSALMSHRDPKSNEEVQHVGFLEFPKPKALSELPNQLRLDDVGTGVFILGFDPQTTNNREWIDEMAKAVVENFFCAIHNKALVVEIASRGAKTKKITHETIDTYFSRLYNDSRRPNGYFYHRAISSGGEPTRIPSDGRLGELELHLLLDEGPSRTAYVNRMGMLISDSREIGVNPISPRGRALWPDFAAVIVPSTDKGDSWSRQMENPSHDAVSPEKIRDSAARRKAIRMFRDARQLVRAAIDDAVGVAEYDSESNIRELHTILPDEFDPSRSGNTQLVSREVRPPSNRMEEVNETPDDPLDIDVGTDKTNNEPLDYDKKNEHNSHQSNGKIRERTGPAYTPRRRATLAQTRFVATGEHECIVAFNLTEPVEHMAIVLNPAGVEPGGREDPIVITSASLDGQTLECGEDGSVSLQAPPVNRRLTLKVTTDDKVSNRAIVVFGNLKGHST